MNTPKPTTPEEKRIAIAEACGWHSIKTCSCQCAPHGLPAGNYGARNYKHLPDYLNDLNAIHEAEKSRWQNAGINLVTWQERYRDALSLVMNVRDSNDRIHATAAQRAEAFLRVTQKEVA